MKKLKRVKSKEDFQIVISKKKSNHSPSFVIYSFNNPNYDYPRYGISASKKLGKAVIRVKIRRQVRAMLRDIDKKITIKPRDYVVIVRKPFLNNDYHTNLQELKNLISQIGG